METKFAYCIVAICPVRSEQKDSSEMVTQMLFGELIIIKEKQNNWIFIESQQDNYEGWIDEKQIRYITLNEASTWKQEQIITTKNTQITGPIGKINISQGSFISKKSPNHFHIGKHLYTSKYNITQPTIIQFSKTYLNSPYLWGGKSIHGIDCSGFTQIVFRSQGLELPRDASQQALEGATIDRKNAHSGDLAFFTNEAGRVIHVGILLSKSKIIHASGRVKIDKLDDTGIWSEELGKYSHTLSVIKRFS